ncbi:MAG: L7Ae/L30e/S12e/Gadd45 family ribosomal protein [Acholeplasmataceae bacterium]|jgi:ribosomal protein L7Ae-like RNA K-turn-binding protein
MKGVLGLIARARKLITGTELVIKGLQKQEVYLVLVSSDASNNTKKKITDKARYYETEILEIDDYLLNQSIGKTNIKVVGITDIGFKELLLKKKGM